MRLCLFFNPFLHNLAEGLRYFFVKIKGPYEHAKLCLVYVVAMVCAVLSLANSSEQLPVVNKPKPTSFHVLIKEDSFLFQC